MMNNFTVKEIAGKTGASRTTAWRYKNRLSELPLDDAEKLYGHKIADLIEKLDKTEKLLARIEKIASKFNSWSPEIIEAIKGYHESC